MNVSVLASVAATVLLYSNAFPQWSPDERRIAFASTRDGGDDFEIYTMNADGADLRRLTFSPGRDAHPYWLSANRLVFQSPRNQSSERIVDLYTMDANGRNQRRLLGGGAFTGVPVPSRDRKRIAFQRGTWDESIRNFHWELFVVDSSGRHERQLTGNAWSSQVPSWRPGDREIVFYANPSGVDQLFVMNVASGEVRPLMTSKSNDTAPSVSPDGRFIAFQSDRGGDRPDLYLLDLSTQDVKRLTTGLAVRSQASWSRDGMRLLFSGVGTGVDEVYVIHRDGTGLTRLTHGTEGTR